MEASWHPDPTGRHHYRWWDGTQWSDQVSDNGVVSTDPVVSAPVIQTPVVETPVPPVPITPEPVTVTPMAITPEPAATAPVTPEPHAFIVPPVPESIVPPSPYLTPNPGAAATPTPFEPAAGGSSAPPKRRTGLYIGLGVAAAVVVIGGAVVALGGGGGGTSGTGVRELDLETDDSYLTHTLDLRQGDLVRIRLEPGRRLDPRMTVLVSKDLAEATSEVIAEDYPDYFTDDPDSVYDDVFTDVDSVLTDGDAEGQFEDLVVYQEIDSGFTGDPDADVLLALADGKYTLVISSADGDSNGKVRMIIEKADDRFDTSKDDLSDIFSDEFATDDAFFSDNDEYTPES